MSKSPRKDHSPASKPLERCPASADSKLSEKKLAQLEALANAATPGVWSWEGELWSEWNRPTIYADRTQGRHGLNLFGRMEVDANGRANLDFVVATDPQTILALIAEIRRLRAVVEQTKPENTQKAPVPGEILWRDLIVAEPRLLTVMADAQKSPYHESDFAYWAGWMELKKRLTQLVGWYRPHGPQWIRSNSAYDCAYQTIYAAYSVAANAAPCDEEDAS